jgi:hypothetical protein
MSYIKWDTPMDGYEARKGLEGPFRFRSGIVLYYDPKEGKYYNPKTDFYLEYQEYMEMTQDSGFWQ